MEIFQFIPLRSPKTTGRLLSPFQNTRHVAVFDLEDSFWVPGIPQQSQELKIRAREQIIRFCAEAADRHRGIRVGVRVNPVGSDCFRLDLDVVKVLRESLALEFLILPKVEEGGEVAACLAELAKAGVTGVGIVPIVESRVAFERIDRILAACREFAVRSVIYGHHDYSLDAGHWPVSGVDSSQYWEIIGSILGKIEQAGLNYIHPPIPALNDVTLLRRVLGRLRFLASRELSILSAGPSQTSVLVSLLRESATAAEVLPPLPTSLLTGPEKRQLAGEVKGLFESNKRSNLSFAADARSGRFISPHEYLAALRYLGGCEGTDS